MAEVTLAICSRDCEQLSALVAQQAHIRVQQSTSDPQQLDTHNIEILIADPDLAALVVDRCPKLIWLQSTWAGNAPLLKCSKRDYQLTVARGIFDKQIREYVFTHILGHVRKTLEMQKMQLAQSSWQSVKPEYLQGKILGVMGTGSLAQALVPVAEAFGLTMIGVSRSGKHISGFNAVYTLSHKKTLAKQADFVVNLLPETAATQGCLNSGFFAAMKHHSLLINAGRGSAVIEDDLLYALTENRPAFAVLDVFEQEPLPRSHRYWQHPQILITQHTAAITDINDIAALFIDNVRRHMQGEPLQHCFDWETGY